MKSKNIILWILAFTLIAAAAAVGIVALVKATGADQTKTLTALNYQIGRIEEDGTFVKDTSMIVTKNYIPVDGLKVTLKKDATVEAYVLLLDKDHKGVESIELEIDDEDKKDVTFDFAAYLKEHEGLKATNAMICIHPLHDTEVQWNEIAGYAKQVTVTYNK